MEAALLASVFGLLPELLLARGVAAPRPHPGWLAVLLLAARDGRDGCLAGLVATGSALVLGAWCAGVAPGPALARLSTVPDLVALATCLLVSWIGSWHLRRHAELEGRLRRSVAREGESEATLGALREAVAFLRARVDRATCSLSFLRDVAGRLESGDPIRAAEAAADLAMARTGAAVAAVKVGPDGFRRLLAVRDARGPEGFEPLELRTADLTVPIRGGAEPMGVLALWGLPQDGLDEGASNDLALIASWCAPALGSGPRRERWSGVHERSVS
jgi:hypothetical protein